MPGAAVPDRAEPIGSPCLVIQHSPTEGLGLLGDWLTGAGLQLDILTPYDGATVPQDLAGYCALIVLGGAMAAWEDDVAPWLPDTRRLLRTAVDMGVPTLGVCLGSQLLALACDGTVERGAAGPEYGRCEVRILQEAADDPLLSAVPTGSGGLVPVVQWHSDAVTALPPDSVLLADSEAYPTQAFRVGDRAWGLQFHLETTTEMVARWASADKVDVDLDALPDLAPLWQPLAARFSALAISTVTLAQAAVSPAARA
jgi:GMP synthase-like glutamine amidotransferase